MKRLNKRIKLVMMAAIAIMGVIFLSHTPSAQAKGYTNTPEDIKFGETYSGTINKASDKYRYNMSIKKPGEVRIIINLSNPDRDTNHLAVEIYNESGKCLYQSENFIMEDTSSVQCRVDMNKGNYYIVVDGRLGTYANTTFRLQSTYYELQPASIKKLTNKAGKKLKITWACKYGTCYHYQIQIATNSKFTKNKKTYTVKNTVTTSKTITKLKKSKKYYVRIRTYTTTLGGTKAYSKWSSVKRIRITK